LSGKESVQDTYLKHTLDRKMRVRISLINGKELRGQVLKFDAFTILLGVGSQEVLVYKSAIAALGPATDGK
jgi:RNA chaperone Hfq